MGNFRLTVNTAINTDEPIGRNGPTVVALFTQISGERTNLNLSPSHRLPSESSDNSREGMAKHHPDLIFCRKQPGVGESSNLTSNRYAG